jgi:hypothetical protein
MAKFIECAPNSSPLKPAPPKPAPLPKPAVPEADVELFRSLLIACDGRVNTNHPPGGGVTDLRIVKAILANGADLEADILPTLRAHVGELAQRPLESWTAPWFVQGVAESHRRRLAAAAQPLTVDDAELIDRLMAAAGGNILTGSVHDVAPIRAMLASGVTIDDILSTLRDKVNRGVTKYAGTLESWGEVRFLKHCALAHLARTVVPAMVEGWTRAAAGEAAGRVEPPTSSLCGRIR